MKKEINELKEGKKKLIANLKNKMSKEKETIEIVKKLTDKNTELLNENKTFKKLYEEELKKNEGGTESDVNEEYIDYDNILFDDDVIEVEELPMSNKTNDKNGKVQFDQCNFKTTNVKSLDNHKMSCHKSLNCNTFNST